MQRLTAAVAQVQALMEANQQQLEELRRQLATLQQQIAAETTIPSGALPASNSSPDSIVAQVSSAPATPDEIQERQAIHDSQIATLDATKVETASKYPLKLSGLVLFNSFVNTRQVDSSVSPAYAVPGSGSTGFSLRQTLLGFDMRGPHVFGSASQADLRVDFFANAAQSNYAANGLLRLRTAHFTLNWKDTQAFVELDRSILEPNQPKSLVSMAQPELTWAGNLWNWNPQVGVSHRFAISDASRIVTQAALIDTFDPQPLGTTLTSPVTQTEASRWPGTEARIAFQHGGSSTLPQFTQEFGVGGYFSPHRTVDGSNFDAWAATFDSRLPLGKYLEITANAYRGQALDGLGAGGYVNYYDAYAGPALVAHALDDIGGWTQLQVKPGQRVEWNAGFGVDNPFAKEVHAASSPLSSSTAATTYVYQGLARNRAFFSNVILSPSAYLLFSLEYKRLWTNYATGPTAFSDSIGIGAGYKF